MGTAVEQHFSNIKFIAKYLRCHTSCFLLQYKLTREELSTVTLWVSVWDWDLMGRNKFLGEVTLPIYEKNFDLSSTRIKKYALMVGSVDLYQHLYSLTQQVAFELTQPMKDMAVQ